MHGSERSFKQASSRHMPAAPKFVFTRTGLKPMHVRRCCSALCFGRGWPGLPPPYILIKFEFPNLNPRQEGLQLGPTFEMTPRWFEQLRSFGPPSGRRRVPARSWVCSWARLARKRRDTISDGTAGMRSLHQPRGEEDSVRPRAARQAPDGHAGAALFPWGGRDAHPEQ